ncbi:hypothetical protein HDU98_003711 [Podochytrium sp. JEL0797]|nr:hypothetical protein HDU98_003711 [Podochytrium sp. JEL0797]
MSAIGTSSLFVGYMLVGPFWDRFGVRPTMLLSSVLFGAGFAGIYLAYCGVFTGGLASIGAVSAYYFVAGLGSCACFLVCYGVNLANFSPQYAGFVSGVLGVFYALAIMVYSQIQAQLFPQPDITRYLLFVTISAFAINFVAAFTIVRVVAPVVSGSTEMRLETIINDGDDVEKAGSLDMRMDVEGVPEVKQATAKEILFSPVFWLLALSYIWQQGVVYFNNIGSVTNSLHFSDDTVSNQLLILSISQVLGRITIGPGSDFVTHRFPRIDRSAFHLGCQILNAVPFALLGLLPESKITLSVLSLSSAIIGFTFGGIWVMYPPLVTSYFGTKSFGAASGLLMFLIPINGIFVSQIIYGKTYDAAAAATGNGDRVVWSTFAISCIALVTAGALYAFSSFSDELQTKFNFTSSDINLMSAIGSSSLFVGYLIVGPCWDYYGVRPTMVLSSVLFGVGFAGIYLAYSGVFTGALASIGAISAYYFVAGLGSTGSYVVCYGVNLLNFPAKYSGFVSGVLGVFYALSILTYSQIHTQLFPQSDITQYLLFVAVSSFVINFVAAFTLVKIHVPIGGVTGGVTGESEAIDGVNPNSMETLVEERVDSEKLEIIAPMEVVVDVTELTPKEILLSPIFWMLALSYIFQQAIVYFNNIGSVANSLQFDSTIVSQQLLILSVCQAIGRVSVGLTSDYITQKFQHVDRSIFHLICQIINALPFAMLGLLPESSITLSILSLSSAVVGFTFGGIWVMYPPLLTKYFGKRYFGTASAFVMCLIPINGIFISQSIYGKIYDAYAVEGKCVGSKCFQQSFLIFFGFQCVKTLLLPHTNSHNTNLTRGLKCKINTGVTTTSELDTTSETTASQNGFSQSIAIVMANPNAGVQQRMRLELMMMQLRSS